MKTPLTGGISGTIRSVADSLFPLETPMGTFSVASIDGSVAMVRNTSTRRDFLAVEIYSAPGRSLRTEQSVSSKEAWMLFELGRLGFQVWLSTDRPYPKLKSPLSINLAYVEQCFSTMRTMQEGQPQNSPYN